jgi:hypothetical protein
MVDRHSLGWGVASVIRQLKSYATRFSDTLFLQKSPQSCNIQFPTRRREDAGDSDEYCDVLIGLPVFKSHGLAGITGAIKLHYCLRPIAMQGDTGKYGHSGGLAGAGRPGARQQPPEGNDFFLAGQERSPQARVAMRPSREPWAATMRRQDPISQRSAASHRSSGHWK